MQKVVSQKSNFCIRLAQPGACDYYLKSAINSFFPFTQSTWTFNRYTIIILIVMVIIIIIIILIII